MGFKLGTTRQPYAVRGDIRNKMEFKTDGKLEDYSSAKIYRKDLAEGVLGEANGKNADDPYSIYISNTIEPDSQKEREVIAHEMRHLTEMKIGKLEYGDDYILWNGNRYPRNEGMILFEDKWIEEGSKEFPWEKM